MADGLITKTDAQWHYGATDRDMSQVTPAKRYYSDRAKCWITLFVPADIELYLVGRYGSLSVCKALADARSAKATAAARKRLVEMPKGWPTVGYLKGSERWAACDTETTGLDPADGHRVVDVSVVIVEAGEVVLEWQSYVNPGPDTVWSHEAEEVNGISAASVADAPTAATVWAKFAELTAGLPIAAHNASFDRKFIAHELMLAGLGSHTNDWHCTMLAAASGRRWMRLDTLYYSHARRWIVDQHTALADAKAVAYLAPRVCR